MLLFCFLTVFPVSVAMSGPYILSAHLASSGVTGQFRIRLFCRISVNSFSEGRPIFLYKARAMSAPSISHRVYAALLEASRLEAV